MLLISILLCLKFLCISAQSFDLSYARSPEILPGPYATGTGEWDVAYNKARVLVSKLSAAEKVNLTYGHTSLTGCTGTSGSAPRVGFPGLCLHDGPAGVRAADGVSAFPAPVGIGASWNRDLALKVAEAMGGEFRRKGVTVALGPVAGPIGRIAKGGRAWEIFSADPYLTGDFVAQSVRGLQKHVIACAKHFVANEQETSRNPPPLIEYPPAVSSNVDDRTMHELYMWPFQDAVRAGVGSVMSAYQRVNNTYSSENSKILNGLLKTELGFQGFVMSDWWSQYSGAKSAAAGLDMVMPDEGYFKSELLVGVKNGSFEEARLDDMATRIIATWYHFGQDNSTHPLGYGIPANVNEPHSFVNARNPRDKKTMLQAAIESHVLVKNTNHALPLKSPKLLSLFGYNARAQPVMNHDLILGLPFSRWMGGLSGLDAPDVLVGVTLGTGLGSMPAAATLGHIIGGGGSGATTGPYVSAPYDAFEQRAYDDDIYLMWDFESQSPSVNAASDACIVFINDFAAEAADRTTLADSWSDTLVKNVAAKCRNTMVVVSNPGIRLVDAWYDNANVTAVIFGHFAGQDSGRALVEVMFGGQSPSGRLPYTVGRQEKDYGELLNPCGSSSLSTSAFNPQCNFHEGIAIDYRHFLARGIRPRLPFGFGLTYSEFEYVGLALSADASADTSRLPPVGRPPVQGGNPALWDVLARVSVKVQNVGSVRAAEVVQLYLVWPGKDVSSRVLRGFGKMLLEPGDLGTVDVALTRRDMSRWDVGLQDWVLDGGEYTVWVGSSVEEEKKRGSLTISVLDTDTAQGGNGTTEMLHQDDSL